MLTLYKFPGRWGLESLSPFCMKVEVYLELAKIPYRCGGDSDPRQGPKRKMPYVVFDDGTRLGDSTAIVERLERAAEHPLDEGLDAGQRALARLVSRTFEEGFYFVALWSRWAEPEGWEVSRTFFDQMPAVARWIVPHVARKQIVASTVAQGTGRHTRDEIYEMGRRDLEAFSTTLGDRKFVLGDRVRVVDVTAYAFLANILRAEIDTPLRAAAQELPGIEAYVDRMAAEVARAK